MCCVHLESAKTKEDIFYEIQYENLPYFCFSCGLLGHADSYCPNPASRDANGRLPYGESMRVPLKKKSWGSAPQRNFGGHFGANKSQSEWEDENDVEKGEEVTSPAKAGHGKVKNTVYQFNSRSNASYVRNNVRGSGTGRKDVYRKVNMDDVVENLR